MLLNQKKNFTDIIDSASLGIIKIGIISDTHEEISEEILAVINNCDIAIHAGDIGCSAVLEALQPKSGHVIAVAGNNDKPYLWDFKDWDLVKKLPEEQTISVPGGTISIEHGHKHDSYKPAHSDLRNAHLDSKLVIYGHTHIQVIDKDETAAYVINPGAAGFTRNKGGSSCIVLTIKNKVWDYKVFKFSD